MTSQKVVHVAVGVIVDQDNLILLAKRPNNLHQGGKWEFPGGKVESNETTTEALIRELKEEVDLNITSTIPLMQIRHDYDDKSVLLDIHKVENFSGKAIGLEGQEIRWVNKNDLPHYDFPEANRAIVDKLLFG
nr:8-oxo-dGTP diphosphatase MutT [Shewanella sp. UCD-KL12]